MTIDAVITLGFGLRANFRFRLTGIDAPERFGRDASQAGKDASEFVEQWIGARDLIAWTEKSSDATVGIGDGAFGRWLAEFVDAETGEKLSDALIEAGFGGTKEYPFAEVEVVEE